jgi:hypothetical protein
MSREVSESAFEYLLSEVLTYYETQKLDNDLIFQRLENLGFEIGHRYIEKISSQLKPLGTEHLDIIKFICKDFWEELFKKKIDKLQTNHRGVFVLSDHKLTWLSRYQFVDDKLKNQANRILQFICGILRGGLTNLGLIVVVSAEYTILPSITFNVRVKNL